MDPGPRAGLLTLFPSVLLVEDCQKPSQKALRELGQWAQPTGLTQSRKIKKTMDAELKRWSLMDGDGRQKRQALLGIMHNSSGGSCSLLDQMRKECHTPI